MPDQPHPRRALIRVAVVDDHPLLRNAIAQLAAESGDMQVVAQGACGRDATAIARRHKPDVMVMDLAMPDQSGFDALAHVRAQATSIGILVLSAYPEQQFAITLLRRGANGYLSKDCRPAEILAAIRAIAAGRMHISASVADLLARQMSESRLPHESLSERELQVLLHSAHGRSPSQIAGEMSLSAKAVSYYRCRVMQKLGVSKGQEITYYAVKHGLI
jgi:two-component system invasion response regulator UvrY